MRDPLDAIASAMDRDSGGIAIIWSPQDFGVRNWLVSEVERLAADREPAVVDTVEAALALPDRLAIIVPRNEREAVLDLDACRERIFAEDAPRLRPVVLVLFREGDGQKALSEAASLRSLTRGNDPDPEALAVEPGRVDLDEERTRFEASTGLSPDAWLAEWRVDRLARNAENYSRAVWADFLVKR
jgi:hypothetical protein